MTKQIALVTGASRVSAGRFAERLADDWFFVVGSCDSDTGADSISNYLGQNGRALSLMCRWVESYCGSD